MGKQKVLIITYYWPPAGGPGVQRWLKFVKYLPQYGFTPIVYCPKNPNYPIIDESLIGEIPKNTVILKQPINEPYRLAHIVSKKSSKKISSGVIPKVEKQSFVEKLMLYIRGNFFIPDARKNWVKPSLLFLENYIKENKIDVVITTGPPHSLHLIGLNLKRQLAIKWLTDFRDPWTTIGYHKALKLTKSSNTKHKGLEHNVLNAADQIIVTSYHTKNEFRAKTNKPITVITNGYDMHSLEIEEKDKLFTLSHVGSLLSDRNPEILWQIFSELIKEDEGFSKAFQLNLVGVVSDNTLESIYKYGLKNHTNIVGYVSHNEAVKIQLKSQILLLIEINSRNTKAIIPGKLFEYLVSKTPILAIGPKGSDVKYIIKETDSGVYFNYNEKALLKTQLQCYFKKYKTNNLKSKAIGLGKYSRTALTEQLANLINKSL